MFHYYTCIIVCTKSFTNLRENPANGKYKDISLVIKNDEIFMTHPNTRAACTVCKPEAYEWEQSDNGAAKRQGNLIPMAS